MQIQVLLVGKIPIGPVNPWNFWGSPQEFFLYTTVKVAVAAAVVIRESSIVNYL